MGEPLCAHSAGMVPRVAEKRVVERFITWLPGWERALSDETGGLPRVAPGECARGPELPSPDIPRRPGSVCPAWGAETRNRPGPGWLTPTRSSPSRSPAASPSHHDHRHLLHHRRARIAHHPPRRLFRCLSRSRSAAFTPLHGSIFQSRLESRTDVQDATGSRLCPLQFVVLSLLHRQIVSDVQREVKGNPRTREANRVLADGQRLQHEIESIRNGGADGAGYGVGE
jgi:hypothetical protein